MKPRKVVVFDTEVYPNWYYLAFRDVTKDTTTAFEHPLDLEKIRKILQTYRVVGFNSKNYDLPLLMLALKGASVEQLKKASDRIIIHDLKPWHFEREFNVNLNDDAIDHIDLMEVAPLTGSLKAYGGRMHSRSLQDLPLPPGSVVSEGEKEILRRYCQNDLQITLDLYNSLTTQLALREEMSKEYGLDLRSKSDAQIAEAVIKKEVETQTGRQLDRPTHNPGDRFHYQVPGWVSFRTVDILEGIRQAAFVVSDKGGILMPEELSGRKIRIGEGVYRMGIGGLHSSEKKQIRTANVMYRMTDFDVVSYYPSILLNQGLYPKHIGPAFLNVYRGIVNRRLEAKRTGNKAISESLKITINGTFGKLSNRWSCFYSPDLFVHIVITGQLALLMLIESFWLAGVEVCSANTDGVTVRYTGIEDDKVKNVVASWELITSFELERAEYEGLWSRDVNAYIALRVDGGVKTKGPYGRGLALHGNPHGHICSKAVIDYLALDADIGETVRQCHDIREFVFTRKVQGGAKWRGQDIGRIVRWYYSSEVAEAITYKVNDHLVPDTLGARPAIELPDEIPSDLDYNWYIAKAQSMLEELGVTHADSRP